MTSSAAKSFGVSDADAELLPATISHVRQRSYVLRLSKQLCSRVPEGCLQVFWTPVGCPSLKEKPVQREHCQWHWSIELSNDYTGANAVMLAKSNALEGSLASNASTITSHQNVSIRNATVKSKYHKGIMLSCCCRTSNDAQ